MMKDKYVVTIDNRTLTLSNLQKRLWPEYTKGQFIEYYTLAAPYILPYLKNRPISLVRYPDGINGKHFYQKDKPPGTPEWIETHTVYSEASSKPIEYLLINDLPSLVFVANLAAIELNPWHSTSASPDNPNWTVVDLDPDPPAGFEEAKEVALLTQEVLNHFNITGYPKISGATGIHIYIPLPEGLSYRQSAELAGFLGKIMQNLNPDLITTERLVKKREGKVYVDHLQNLRGQTIVAPYSLRPRAKAPISMPIRWKQIRFVQPNDFTLGNFSDIASDLDDPFLGLLQPLGAEEAGRIRHLIELAQTPEITNI